MATLPGSLSDADRAAWEETARALDAIGAPQTEARFYSMFQECRAANDGPLDLPGLGGDGARSCSLHDAPLYFSGGATGAPPGTGGPFGGGVAASNSAGAGTFAMLAQQGGMVGLVGTDAPVAAMPPVPPSAAVAQPNGTQAVEELDDDGLETIVLADDGPSPGTGARGQGCGGSLEERVLSGDLRGGSVLFDNFTEGMDGDGGADLVGASEAATSVKDDNDDDNDETFASVALSAPRPGAVGGPLGRRPRGALLAESRDSPAAVAVPSAPSSCAGPVASPTPATDPDEMGEQEGAAATEAGEPVEIDPDFDYDIPASRLTSRLGGLGMPGPTSVGVAGGREGPVDSTGGDDPELEAAHAAAVTEALRGVRPDLAEQLLGAGRKV